MPSASIYSDTDVAVRLYFIRQFLECRIKVLANYQVLATGFDAPKTATIVISRPVFSPVRYMQMVGRGLRGPKNGGTETCKIITVVEYEFVSKSSFEPTAPSWPIPQLIEVQNSMARRVGSTGATSLGPAEDPMNGANSFSYQGARIRAHSWFGIGDLVLEQPQGPTCRPLLIPSASCRAAV